MSEDIWCDFCGDKPKSVLVKERGRFKAYHICNHCESLAAGYQRVYPEEGEGK